MKIFRLIRKFTIIIAVVSMILQTSCGNNLQKSEDSYSFDDFKSVDLSSSRELICDDPDVIGKPLSIKIINDSILAIARMDGSKHVVLYNTVSGANQVAVVQGGGPLEMINVGGMSIDKDGSLLLVGQMDKKIMSCRWNDNESDEAISQLKMQSPVDALRGVGDGRGGLVIFPAVADSVRLIMVNDRGEAVDSIKSFPKAEMPEGVVPSNFIFQASICYSPENEKLAIANLSWNEISIHDFRTGGIKKLKAPLKEEIKIQKRSHGDAYSVVTSPLWRVYSGISACRKSFITGFVGVKLDDNPEGSDQCSQLLEFDWEGNPLRSFSSGTDIDLFDVDFDNGYIYTIENDPDPCLYRYKTGSNF